MSLLLAGAPSRSLPQAAGVGSQPAARAPTPGPGPGLGAASGSTAGRSCTLRHHLLLVVLLAVIRYPPFYIKILMRPQSPKLTGVLMNDRK